MIKNCFFFALFTLVFLSNILADDLKPYKVYLRPGTILTDLKDHKDQRITRGIYAYVLETNPLKRDHFIVYNKAMEAIFETTALGIVEIKKDVMILPDIDAQTIYPAPSVLKSNSKNAFFDTQFNLHLDNINPAAFNSLYETQFKRTLGTRVEIRTLYNSILPANFGFSLNYQTASFSDLNNELFLSAISFGPCLQHYIYEKENIAVSFLLGGEFSPNYQTSVDEFTDKYNVFMLDLGSEALWQSDWGKLSAGLHFRRYDLKLSSSSRTNISPLPGDITINSIGAMLGYKYEWDL